MRRSRGCNHAAMDDSMGGEEVDDEEVDDEETEPSNPRPGGDGCFGPPTLVFAWPCVAPSTSPCWRSASIAAAAEDDDEDDAAAAVQSDVARLSTESVDAGEDGAEGTEAAEAVPDAMTASREYCEAGRSRSIMRASTVRHAAWLSESEI
jgi:hypothetical protein